MKGHADLERTEEFRRMLVLVRYIGPEAEDDIASYWVLGSIVDSVGLVELNLRAERSC